jgi:hypothetical protein
MTYSVTRRAVAALALAALPLFLSGCFGRSSATGTVTFNGAAVDDGAIIFTPEADETAKATAKIVDGKFTIPAGSGLKSGKNRVEIFWHKKTGKQVDTPGDTGAKMDETVQVIPSEFNAASTLTKDVNSGENTFTFELTGTANTPGRGDKPRVGDKRARD